MSVDNDARGLAGRAIQKVESIIASGNTISLSFTDPLTLPAGNSAQLANLGTITNPVIQLSIPRGANGKDGAGVEFRVSDGYIQLKYSDSDTWSNLISLSELTGDTGNDGEKGVDGSDGFSPTITIYKQTETEYILEITTADGSYLTPNLQGQNGSGDSSDIDLSDYATIDYVEDKINKIESSLTAIIGNF